VSGASLRCPRQIRPWGIAVYVGEGHAGGKEGTYGKGMELGTSIEFQPLSRIGFMFDLNRLEHSGSISDVNGTPDWDIEGTELQASGKYCLPFFRCST
jgi:hypothetical protein